MQRIYSLVNRSTVRTHIGGDAEQPWARPGAVYESDRMTSLTWPRPNRTPLIGFRFAVPNGCACRIDYSQLYCTSITVLLTARCWWKKSHLRGVATPVRKNLCSQWADFSPRRNSRNPSENSSIVVDETINRVHIQWLLIQAAPSIDKSFGEKLRLSSKLIYSVFNQFEFMSYEMFCRSP